MKFLEVFEQPMPPTVSSVPGFYLVGGVVWIAPGQGVSPWTITTGAIQMRDGAAVGVPDGYVSEKFVLEFMDRIHQHSRTKVGGPRHEG